MSDPLSWSINLGRWSGIHVRIHVLLIVFAAGKLLDAALLDKNHPVVATAGWLLLLLLALVLHELGHAAAAARLGVEPDEVRLWPLGNLIGPSQAMASRSTEGFLAALAGPGTNAVVALVTAIGLKFADARMVVNPFGYAAGGAPFVTQDLQAAPFTTVWWIGWFGYLNLVLCLANLIPALPLDGGRMLRAVLVGYPKDGMVAPWTARTCAMVLGLAGLAKLLYFQTPGGWALIGLALLIEWMVRTEARMLEDGGFFDDGVFGYDFSEGYTSLESSTPKVRPYRESALKRWRRRRSELRRQRREAKEAAEEQRMDEILAKLHREGRSSLTDDEYRFLIRVSVKYRSKPKARD